MKFDELGLSTSLLEAVEKAGYTSPTPIQEQAIPAALSHRDVLGIAQTGTGKTASFTLPMIEILSRGRARARMPRSLILTPTRELASQIADNFNIYGVNHNLTMALLIGGVSFEEQDRKLDRGVDVLIATPGRLLDQFERGKVLLTGVQVLVVDEADRMLDMGFIPDIEKIFKLTPFTRQTLFFSATMPKEIERLTNTFLQNPLRIEIAKPSSTVSLVKQSIVSVPSDFKAKRDILRELISEPDVSNAIIFCNRKRDVSVVAQSLEKHGFSAAALHGDLDQSVRLETLDSFRAGTCKFLVASDVAARGLDIPAVSHVFNFDVPLQAEDYVHRIGRTGRAGLSGVAITLASKADSKGIRAIENETGQSLEKLEIGHKEADELEAVEAEPKKNEVKKTRSRKSTAKKAEPNIAEQKPITQSDHDPSAADQNSTSAPSKAKRDDQETKSSSSSRRHKNQVVGLGDHTPAFLMRPIPELKSKPKEVA